MTQLATLTDVEAVTGSALADPAAASRLIEMASAVVERFCRRDFTFVADEEIVVSVTDGVLRLPDPPVTEVASIVDPDGNTVDSESYTVTLSSGLVALDWSTWDGPPWHTRGWLCGDYTVVYSHGYDPIPDEVAFVVASMVARQIATPQLVVGSNESIGDWSGGLQLGAEVGLTLTSRERSVLGPYRRRVFSVPMSR